MNAASGTLGTMSARSFLHLLESGGWSGTLALLAAPRSAFILLKQGRVARHLEPGHTLDIDQTHAQFCFFPHPETHLLPTLPSAAEAELLWTLPPLGVLGACQSTETDLTALLTRLRHEAFSGLLALTSADLHGAVLVDGGRLRGAVALKRALGTQRGAAASAQRGAEALQTLVHPQRAAALRLHGLPESLIEALSGYLQAVPETHSERPEGFSGLELTPECARYYHAGSAYLQVLRPQPDLGDAGYCYYPAQPHGPSLHLPDDAERWAEAHFQLTLRGRDALNPMTELAMRFRGEFGRTGQRVLEELRRSSSAGHTAELLGVAPEELKAVLGRLETEGFIRSVHHVA